MPLRVLNLDDRTYDDLVEEALAMLPRYAPAWTNHNPSDPGITVIELLAYITELLIYRLNRVTRESKLCFLQLLGGAEKYHQNRWAELSSEEVENALRQAVRDLRRTERAVSAEDYQYLAAQATAQNPPAMQILRARPFVRRNLQAPDVTGRENDVPGHVSIVVLPAGELPQDAVAALTSQVRDYLEPRRLLTTRLHVVAPFFLWIKVSASVHGRPDAVGDLRAKALDTLEDKFSPWPPGGPQGEGWPFGRALYLSEIYEALEQADGVDYVDDVDVVGLSTQEAAIDERDHIGIKVGRSIVGVDSRLGAANEHGRDRILRDTAGRFVGIALRPYELIRIASRPEDFSGDLSSAAQGSADEQNLEVST
jgi:hypothetical protein